MVLLKNDNSTLPLAKDTPLIFVAGQAANDVGIQCGGWTVEWQGASGSITPGTTILDAIESTVSEDSTVVYNKWGRFERVTDEIADVAIVVVGEMPYAEGIGDRADLTLSQRDIALIELVRGRSERIVVILISGRPMVVTEHLDQWDAFVAAWLPGTEGQGVADVLFGDYPFAGRLSYTWPRSMDQVPLSALGSEDPLFPLGYGLDVDGNQLR